MNNYNAQVQHYQQQQLNDVQRQQLPQGQAPAPLSRPRPGETREPVMRFSNGRSIANRLENARRQALAEARQAAQEAKEAQEAADKRASNVRWGGAFVLLLGAGALGLRFKGAKPRPKAPVRKGPTRPPGRR
jgi:hypothetical protein